MAERVYMAGDPPRLITSKAGYNASPSLADINKTFDSDWFGGCGIRWIFDTTVSRPSQLGNTVYFPYPLNHIPRCIIDRGGYNTGTQFDPAIPGYTWPVAKYGPFYSTSWQESNLNCRVYNDRVYVQPSFSGGGDAYRYRIIVLES